MINIFDLNFSSLDLARIACEVKNGFCKGGRATYCSLFKPNPNHCDRVQKANELYRTLHRVPESPSVVENSRPGVNLKQKPSSKPEFLCLI